MTITHVNIWRYRLPLALPIYAGNTVLRFREGLIVEVCSGDICGWGEFAPLPGFHPWTLTGVLKELRQVVPALRKLVYPETKVTPIQREIMRLVSPITPTDVRFRLDAQERWDVATASRFFHALGPAIHRVEYVEDPIASRDDLADFSARTGVKVAVDIRKPEEAKPDVLQQFGVYAAVVKPEFWGSWFPTRCPWTGNTAVFSANAGKKFPF